MGVLGSAPAPPILSNYGSHNKLNFWLFHVYIMLFNYLTINNCSFFFLKGDIIFNARYPELPPDFIFGEDADFLPEPSELPVSNFNLETSLKLTFVFNYILITK